MVEYARFTVLGGVFVLGVGHSVLCKKRLDNAAVVRRVEANMAGETAVIVIAARQRGPVAITIQVEDQQAIGARPPGPHERVGGPDVAIPHALLLPARRVRVNGLGVGVGVGVGVGLGLGLG